MDNVADVREGLATDMRGGQVVFQRKPRRDPLAVTVSVTAPECDADWKIDYSPSPHLMARV